MKNLKNSEQGFLLITLSIGLVWARSNWEKLIGGKFVDSLGVILTKAAEHNPYSWYKSFLQNTAIPNSIIFAQMVLWGEFLVAAAIIFSSVYLLKKKNRFACIILILGLSGGFFLNLNFWLAFAWTSPSSDNLNLLMAAIELIGVIIFYRGKMKPTA